MIPIVVALVFPFSRRFHRLAIGLIAIADVVGVVVFFSALRVVGRAGRDPAPRAVVACGRFIVVVNPRCGTLEIIHLVLVEIGIYAPCSARPALGAAKSGNDVINANQIKYRGEGARWNSSAHESEQRLPPLGQEALGSFPAAHLLRHGGAGQNSGDQPSREEECSTRIRVVVVASHAIPAHRKMKRDYRAP